MGKFQHSTDSIGVGEDGPTHQPIEQLALLRAILGLIVLRLADAKEVVESWRVIMRLSHEPAVIVSPANAADDVNAVTRYRTASKNDEGALNVITSLGH